MNAVKHFANFKVNHRHYQSASGNCMPFQSFMNHHKQIAEKSLVVAIDHPIHINPLHNFLLNFGEIENVFKYQLRNNKHAVIMEFKDKDSIHSILSERHDQIDFRGCAMPFAKYKCDSSFVKKATMKKVKFISCDPPTWSKTLAEVCLKKNLSEQMYELFKVTTLNEFEFRRRFLLCLKLEYILPTALKLQPIPFGSSVNGFGMHGCDLDICLPLPKDLNEMNEQVTFSCTNPSINMERIPSQYYLNHLADSMSTIVPFFGKVTRILNARTPIISFHDQLCDLDCDVSASNLLACEMSEIFYTYAYMDDRVQPLVYFVRKWGKLKAVSGPGASQKMTNFNITLLVLFYLMNTTIPVIPNIRTLKKMYRIGKGIEVTQQHSSKNTESLEELLRGFFEFYAKFDYDTLAVDLNYGESVSKPNYEHFYISYPMLPNQNAARNINDRHFDNWIKAIKNAHKYLQSHDVVHFNDFLNMNRIKIDEIFDEAAEHQ